MSKIMEKLFLQQREQFEQDTRKRNANLLVPKGVTLTTDIPYIYDDDAAHQMDIYEPAHPMVNRPVIINIHGGGLIMGSKDFNARYCFQLCQLGFLVFSIEYLLVPDVIVFQQLNSISSAMNSIGLMLYRYYGDPDRVYMVGDSAGAYLITYAVAMQHSPELAHSAGVRPSFLDIQALGLISGMFYTCRLDKIGLFLPKYLYGKNYRHSSFAPYTNPEHPALLTNLPPCFLITSEKDMLQRYTLDFAKALGRRNRPYSLMNFPSNPRLTHAFSVFEPELPESIDATKEMCKYLSMH